MSVLKIKKTTTTDLKSQINTRFSLKDGFETLLKSTQIPFKLARLAPGSTFFKVSARFTFPPFLTTGGP